MTNKDLARKVKEVNAALGHTEASGKKFKVIYNMNRKYSVLFGSDVLMEFSDAEGAIAHLESIVKESK